MLYVDGGTYIGNVDTAQATAERLVAAGNASEADRRQLLLMTDQLRGSVKKQLELYAFARAIVQDELEHH